MVEAVTAVSGSPLSPPVVAPGLQPTLTSVDGKVTITAPCAGGGTMSLSPGQGTSVPIDGNGPFNAEFETVFTACRSRDVTLNGREHVTFSGTYDSFRPMAGSTMTREGVMTFGLNGVEGRRTFNCTLTFGPTPGAITASGTATWEYPIGTPISGMGCGPSSSSSQ